jgi:Ca2+-binding EF-hand superfamily protein
MFSPVGNKKVLLELERAKTPQSKKNLLSSIKKGPASASPIDVKAQSQQRSPQEMLARMSSRQSFDFVNHSKAMKTQSLEEWIQDDGESGDAARKLMEVAIRYRPERDSAVITAFNTCSLTPQEFRQLLINAFKLFFTDGEFKNMIRMYAKDGIVDGSEFLVSFVRLASIKKTQIAQSIRQRQESFNKEAEERTERKRIAQEMKNELTLSAAFDTGDRLRALEKLKEAAKKYNKTHPSALPLDAFEGSFMTPAVFREMLKRTFNLKLDKREISALIKEFDDNENGRIECSEFILHFSRLGFLARNKETSEQREKQRKMIADAERQALAKQLEADSKNKLSVDMDFSEADEARFNEKLTIAAKKYDKNHPAAMALDGFDVAALDAGEFRELLKRTFNMFLSPKEIGVAFKTFDLQLTGKIPCQDFLIKFFQIGFEERNRDFTESLEKQRQANIAAAKKHEQKVDQMVNKTNLALPETYEDFDLENAMEKIKMAAIKYNKNHPSALNLQGFEGKFLSAGVYREMVKRTFNVKLSPHELAALVKKFDTAENGTVDTTEFLRIFFKLGFHEKGKIRTEQLERQRFLISDAHEEQDRKEKEKEDKGLYSVDFDYDEDDRDTALGKMTVAASKYDKNHPSSVGLDGFSGKFVTPVVFKELLRRTFNLKLLPKELGALVQHFDKDGEGTVDCTEFLNVFFKLGYDERCRWHSDQIIKQRDAIKERKEEEIRKLNQVAAKMELSWDDDFSPEDNEAAMVKLRRAAMKYDRNHPASVGLDAFEVAYLTPGQFREQLKRTFNTPTSAKELGALLHYFKAKPDGSINCSDFLTEFMRLGYTQRQSFHKEMLVKQRSAIKDAEKGHQDKMAAQWDKGGSDVAWECSEEEASKAIEKLRLAASKYDKAGPAAATLEAFSCKNLHPTMFREMVKLTFNLKLNPRELGVVVKRYDVTGERLVDCSEFVTDFLRMGFEIRNEAAEAQRAKQREEDKAATEKLEKRHRDQANRAGFEANFDYTELERRNALRKFLDAATKYDKMGPGAMSLRSFEADKMSHGQFREMVKLTFQLMLDPAELGVIVMKYDPERTGFILCHDFLLDFLKLGVDERDKKNRDQIEKNRAAERFQKQEAARKLKDAEDRMELEINFDFDDKDEAIAFEKLMEAARKYDKNHPAAVPTTGFDCKTMTPGVFREMCKRTFNLTLNGNELGAIFKFFGATERKKLIRCQEFLIHFNKVGNAERNKIHSESLKKQRDASVLMEKERLEKLDNQWSSLNLDCDWNFSKADQDSVMAKFTHAAKDYDPYHPSSMSLHAFETTKMIPSVFREMLKRILNMKLNNKEFGGIVKYFDTDNSNTVDCAEFLTKFTTIGFTEKERIRAIEREKMRVHEKKVKAESAEKIKALSEKANTFANYDFAEGDFNSALEKLRVALAGYDKYHPSAVSLDGFSAATLTAGQFREVLKLTFGVILTPTELGAMVRYFSFDSGGGAVETSLFMKHYTLVRRIEKDKMHKEGLEANKEMVLKRDAIRKKREEESAKEKVEQLNYSFKDEDSLLKKLRTSARKFAIDSSSYIEALQQIKGTALPPVAFREVFNRIFLLRLSFPEMGALLSIVDESGLGLVDGDTFVKMFYKLSRLEEKDMFANVAYEKSHIGMETLRASQTTVDLRSLNAPSASSVSSPNTMSASAKGFARSQANMSTQASEKDIETFTEMTLNNSWILPQVASSPKRGRKSAKKMSNDDFQPVQLKTITPKKYQNHAGTHGLPSQATSVTFVPGLGHDTGTQGDVSALTREFSSFDFSLNNNASAARGPAVHAQTQPAKKSRSNTAPASKAMASQESTTPERAPSPGSKPGSKPASAGLERDSPDDRAKGSPGKAQASGLAATSPPPRGIAKSGTGAGAGSGKKEKASSGKRPKTGGVDAAPPAQEPAPFFFPNLMGSPSKPIVLSFKPLNLDDYI